MRFLTQQFGYWGYAIRRFLEENQGEGSSSEAYGGYSALVYIDGSFIIARDYKGDLIASGTAGIDDASVINSAITHVNGQLNHGLERGFIFGKGLRYYLEDTIILKAGVTLKDFVFWIKDGVDKDGIKIENFDSLTGTDTPATDSSVPHSFGLIDVTVYGNRDNNTSGSGVKIYGYGFILDGLAVKKCAEHGLWCECGYCSGSGYSIVGENRIGSIWAVNNGKCGIVHKGPNDTVYGYVITYGNGAVGTPGHGMYITGTRGNCDIRYIHSYGNGEDGVNVDEGFINAIYIEAESNEGRGLVLKDHWHPTVQCLYAYHNKNEALYVSGVQYGGIDFALIRDNDSSGNTVYISAEKFYANIICNNSSGSDLCNFGKLTFSRVNLILLGNTNTGKAVVLGTTDNKILSNVIDVQVSLSNTNGRLMEIHSDGRNIIRIRGATYDSTKDWDYSTYPPHSTDEINYKTNTLTYTLPEKTGSATITSGNTSVTVNHGLPTTPTNIQLTGTHSEVKDAYVPESSITDTSFEIHVDSAVTADRAVYWKAKV